MSTIEQALSRTELPHHLAPAFAIAGLQAFDDDLCPPWWPRRWPPRAGIRRDVDLWADMIAAEQALQALTLIAASTQWRSAAMAREARLVAVAHLREAGPVLARGAAEPWDGPWCATVPHHPRWPWASSNPMPGLASDPMPAGARAALDAARLLTAYDAAAQLADGGVRVAATQAIGHAFVAQLAHGLG